MRRRKRPHIEDLAIRRQAAMKVLAVIGCIPDAVVEGVFLWREPLAVDLVGFPQLVGATSLWNRLPIGDDAFARATVAPHTSFGSLPGASAGSKQGRRNQRAQAHDHPPPTKRTHDKRRPRAPDALRRDPTGSNPRTERLRIALTDRPQPQRLRASASAPRWRESRLQGLALKRAID